MIIKEIFKNILSETESAVPANALGSSSSSMGPVEMYDKILKLRKMSSLSNVSSEGKSGPTIIPSDNPVKNSLNNKNKITERNPLERMKDNDPLKDRTKLRRKVDKTKPLGDLRKRR